MIKNKVYAIIAICAGSIALFFSPCLIKTLTGYPCPACGTRRAVVCALKGHFGESLQINPYGILFLLIGLYILIAYLYSRITHTDFLHQFNSKAEKLVSKKYMIIIFILLMLLNWSWNIHKGI